MTLHRLRAVRWTRSRWTLASACALAIAGCGAERPNLLLVVVDALRKDALHVYGNPEPVSPNIDALAARGWVFENHVAHASQTVPSVLSLMLSRLPADHGIVHRHPAQWLSKRPVYPEEFLFLAEVLRSAGYATAGFVGNPYLTGQNGFAQGFEQLLWLQGRGEQITGSSLRWLHDREDRRSAPFFLYLHYMDVHQPYRPPRDYRLRFAPKRDGRVFFGNQPMPDATPQDRATSWAFYLACVAYVDDQIGAVLAELARQGIDDDTIVVVTSDHGDEFLEHGGIGHGTTVYGELVRVPLVIAYPPALAPGRRVTHLSQHLDLAPSLLRLADVPVPPAFRGTSVFDPAPRAFVDEGPWRGVYAGGFKLVLGPKRGESALFAMSDEHDLAPADDPGRAGALHTELDSYLALEAGTAPRTPDAASPWSPEELERLHTLGYVQ